MLRTRALLALLIIFAGCRKGTADGGLLADIAIDPMAKVTCLELQLSSDDGTVLVTRRFERGDKSALEIGIGQTGEPSLPADIRIRALGLWSSGAECGDQAKPNSAASEQAAHFTVGKVEKVSLTVRPPSPQDDADGDTFIGTTKGGPDCDDSQRAVNPGATEVCTMLTDMNCNGRLGCDDAMCAGVPCARPPVALAFVSAPQVIGASLCSQPIIIEARDSMGQPAPVGSDVAVALAEVGSALSLRVYEDSGCTIPATMRAIPRQQTQVRFYVRSQTAGTTNISAQGGGFVDAQQELRVAPGTAISIGFRTPPRTVKSDTCSQGVTLDARDTWNNAAPVTATVPVTLTLTPATGITLYSDASCTTPLMMPALMSGTPSLTFFFRPARTPAMVRVDASAGALGMASQTETVVAGDPTRIVFATTSQRVVAGVCSGAMTLKLQDAQGTDTAAPAAVSLGLSGPTLSFFSGSGCAAASMVTAAAIPAGAGQATVYFIATGAGMPTVTASGPGLSLAMQTQTVDPAPPVKLGFTTPAQGVQTTLCSGPVRLSTLDAFDNPSNVTGAALAIALSATPPSGFSFFPGPGCSNPAISSLSIPPGMNTVTFSYRGDTAGTVTMLADSALNPDPTQVTNIGVMPPSNLVYLTGPQTRIANQCSGAVTLESRDNGGNRSNVGSDLVIALNASVMAPGFRFFSDPQCSTAVTQVTLPANQSQVTFYFLGTTATAVTMTPASSLMGPGPQTATIRPAAASALAFLAPPRSITAGGCAGQLVAQAQDAFGNVAPVAGDHVLAVSGLPAAGLTFHSDAACMTAPITSATIVDTQSQVTFYARGTVIPSYTLAAQNAALGTASQALTVGAAGAAKLTLATQPQVLGTGVCSGAFTIERRDMFDNLVTAATPLAVTLASTPGSNVTFYTAMGCGSGATGTVNIPASAPSVTVYFRGTTPGMPTLTVSSGALTPATQQQTIFVSAPTTLVFSTAPQSSVTAGTISMPVTLEARDMFGNASPVTSNLPVMLSVSAMPFDLCGDPGCVSLNPMVQLTANQSSATFFFRSNVAGPYTLTASSSLGNPTQLETVVPADATQLVFTTGPQARDLGTCSNVVTVQRRDQFGNPVTAGGAMPLMLSASPSSGFTFHAAAGCAMPAIGTATIPAGGHSVSFHFNGTVPGTVVVSATASSVTVAQQNETLNPIPPSRLGFLAAPGSVTAGACSGVFTLEARDAFNNPATVAASTLITTTASGPANATFYSDAACTQTMPTTIAAMGTTASFYLKATGAGAHMVNAQNAGLGMVASPLTVNPDAPVALQFTSSPLTLRVQECLATPAAVRTIDVNGNTAPVAGAVTLTPGEVPVGGVTFWQEASCSTPLASIALTAGGTGGSFYLKGGNTPQTVQVTVTATGGITSASQNQTVNVGLPNKLVITSATKSLMAGECSGAMTVQSQDVASNPSAVAANTAVTLSAPAGAGVTFYNSTNCSGGAVSQVTMNATTNSVTFSMRVVTGGTPNLNATGAGIPNAATQGASIAPAVRTGACTLMNGSGTQACPISPALNADLTKTFFLFQATSESGGLGSTAVRCVLTDAATLTCSRGGTVGAISIRWYTVSRAAGLNVQHFPAVSSPNPGGTPTTTLPISAVNTASSFVLMSTSVGNVLQVDEERWSSVRLASSTSVEIRRRLAPNATLTHSIQVVEWTGAAVDRPAASLSIPNNDGSESPPALTSSSDPAFLLYSSRAGDGNNNRDLCRLAIRGTLTPPTMVTFTRGLGGTGTCDDGVLDVDFERVRLPGHRVDNVLVTMPAAAVDAAPVMLAMPVDLTRTVAFFGNTSFAGQAMGESSDIEPDTFRDALARASFTNDSTVQVSRGEPTSTSTTASSWSMFVWQVDPSTP